jgi:DNA-binding transcriptional LysR family regulator
MIETYLLEALIAYEKYGTLILASENLHISQPALSRAMQKLEVELGVPLFNRQKNKLSLNENGKLAVEYAKKILNLQQEMMDSVKNLDASTRTLSIGSIAPGPIIELEDYLDKKGIQSDFELVTNEAKLIEGYTKHKYQLIVLSHPLDEYPSKKLITEQLYALVMPAHPASDYKEISFQDMNGQSFLMLSDVGYWADVVKRNMPDSRFIVQNTLQDLHELITSSALPAFASNITIAMASVIRKEE